MALAILRDFLRDQCFSRAHPCGLDRSHGALKMEYMNRHGINEPLALMALDVMNMAAAVPSYGALHQEFAAIVDDHVAYCSRAHPSRK